MGRWLTETLLICALALLFAANVARASEYFGQITFGGLPVPGATVTARQGSSIITVTSDERGLYRFPDLSEGKWAIEISLQCFAPIRTDVTIVATNPPGKFELTLLPDDQLKKNFENLVDPLLALTKCPDFIVNRGHYFGTDTLDPKEGEPGLSDQDKEALIQFLKTF